MTLAALSAGALLLFAAAVVAMVKLLGEGGPLLARLRWLFWPLLALCGFITELAYLRLIPSMVPIAGMDKAIHFLLFGALALFLDLWLRGRSLRVGRLPVPWALILVGGGAALEEGLQALSSARSMELLDLLSDLTGIVLGVALARLLQASHSRRRIK